MLWIAEVLSASEYINTPGYADHFGRSKFKEAEIKLTIQTTVGFAYDCDGYNSQPNLSTIDVMTWNSPDIV